MHLSSLVYVIKIYFLWQVSVVINFIFCKTEAYPKHILIIGEEQ